MIHSIDQKSHMSKPEPSPKIETFDFFKFLGNLIDPDFDPTNKSFNCYFFP